MSSHNIKNGISNTRGKACEPGGKSCRAWDPTQHTAEDGKNNAFKETPCCGDGREDVVGWEMFEDAARNAHHLIVHTPTEDSGDVGWELTNASKEPVSTGAETLLTNHLTPLHAAVLLLWREDNVAKVSKANISTNTSTEEIVNDLGKESVTRCKHPAQDVVLDVNVACDEEVGVSKCSVCSCA
jgi:hypothetical protein